LALHKLARINNLASFCWNLYYLSAIDVVTTVRCGCLRGGHSSTRCSYSCVRDHNLWPSKTVSDHVTTLLNCRWPMSSDHHKNSLWLCDIFGKIQ